MEKIIELKIPNLGEAESTEIIEVNVKKGDKILQDDPLIVLESEKAAMEVPSDYAGEIQEVLIDVGSLVSEGEVFAKIICEEKESEGTTTQIEKKIEEENVNENIVSEEVHIDFKGINAGPAVRKYARELEINLNNIKGTGKNSRITKEDLKNFIKKGTSSGVNFKSFSESDISKFGDYEIKDMPKIRTLAAQNLHSSWISIPHVTHFEEVDLSFFYEYKKNNEASLLSFITKATCIALEEFPQFNSSLVEENKLLYKKYINIGFAVDTEAGLVVPVLKDANKKKPGEISKAIADLADKARSRKLLEKDMKGGTFTISSLGKIGGIGFTPIINPPEVAILAISRSKSEIFLNSKKNVSQRDILPISLSYDHRVINGGDAGRFMIFLKEMIEGKINEFID